MYEVAVEKTFAAGHALRNYKGKCENVHGHNYKVRVTLESESLASNGLLVDFVDLKKHLMAIIDRLDHQFMNDVEPFTRINPSAENLARYFYDELAGKLGGMNSDVPFRIAEVRIWETDTSIAAYRG